MACVELAEREARRALACVVEAGDPRLAESVARRGAPATWRRVADGSGERAWAARASALDLDQVVAAEGRAGARFIIPGDEEWPEQLEDLARCPITQGAGGPPVGLWVRGRPLARLVSVAVSIVGSRAATRYGERVAEDLAAGLAEAGICVVSGAAFGIDAAAHRGSLALEGPTVAVLACGVDEAYPRQNASLIEQVARQGSLVSEYPPGEHPTRLRFLARNRLIAALSEGTVLVEAAVRSGARNTVTWATGCGRPVMAVPGPVGNVTSFTPHRLIREGEAVLVTSVDDIRELVCQLGTVESGRPRCEHLLDGLGAGERTVYEALPARGGRDIGALALRAGVPVPACLVALGKLADAGLARRRADGQWGLGDVGDRPLLPLDADEPAAAP